MENELRTSFDSDLPAVPACWCECGMDRRLEERDARGGKREPRGESGSRAQDE